MAHQKYKNIIFDLGGVLIYFNREELIKSIFKNEHIGAAHLADAPLTREWLEMDRGVLTPLQVSQALASRFQQDKLLHFIQSIPAYLKPLQEGVEIFSAVKALGYKTYILSNMADFTHEAICKETDLLSQFDGAIFSYQVQAVKPDADIYKKLLETYSLNAEECLFIDDLEVNIEAGRAMNIDGIVCHNHADVRQELKALKVLD